jgi:hypothetical protein
MARYNGHVRYEDADIFTCRDCGKRDRGYYVQPQPEGYALCHECIGVINLAIRAARKAQLAALPRCEVDGCKARGSLIVAGGVLMCGRHHKRAESNLQGFGILGLAFTYNKANVLSLAAK